MSRGSLDILLVHLADRDFAFPADRVREVVRAVSLSSSPVADSRLEGLLNLRGEPVPVLALGDWFGAQAAAMAVSDNLVVLESECGPIAIRSERPAELCSGESTESPANAGIAASGLLEGYVRRDERIIGVIDVDRLARELGEAGESGS